MCSIRTRQLKHCKTTYCKSPTLFTFCWFGWFKRFFSLIVRLTEQRAQQAEAKVTDLEKLLHEALEKLRKFEQSNWKPPSSHLSILYLFINKFHSLLNLNVFLFYYTQIVIVFCIFNKKIIIHCKCLMKNLT